MDVPLIVRKDPWLTPYTVVIQGRSERLRSKQFELTAGKPLSEFANGHLYFGMHYTRDGWVCREWAPYAREIYLTGTFNDWKESEDYRYKPIGNGNWELKLDPDKIKGGDLYKLSVHWPEGKGERIPAYARYVVQDPDTFLFSACVLSSKDEYKWQNKAPEIPGPPLIYEAHIGMATEEYKVGSYDEFRINVLPRIIKAGYNTLQLMAIQEHPYYGSFGYQVSSIFAASSRFGKPADLKRLIDEAHGAGMRVIMDLIHSHAVKNENEGLSRYDGSGYQFFHTGARREHVAWDSVCYNYGKNEVIHFLLSNIQFWLKEYRFDGFRFDGVTSMLYYDHGLSRDFTEYGMYFDGGQDEDAIVYLGLANKLTHEHRNTITIAEEMSGYPGLAARNEEGGLGFDYRMAMGTPDYWIKIIKERPDEQWNVDELFYELTRKRVEERTIGYAESHDQALVGDQTLIFRLIGKEMYFHMSKSHNNLIVDRGIALHKMIRLATISTSGDGYLNFMGNEFGHPEWIDFPRKGNNWSYHYARRQWRLADDQDLRYHFLGEFDRKMIELTREYQLMKGDYPERYHGNPADKVFNFERRGLVFVFNFHPSRSFEGYGIKVLAGKYKVVLDSDEKAFGGQNRIDHNFTYRSMPEKSFAPDHMLKLYLPARTAIVLRREKTRTIYDLD